MSTARKRVFIVAVLVVACLLVGAAGGWIAKSLDSRASSPTQVWGDLEKAIRAGNTAGIEKLLVGTGSEDDPAIKRAFARNLIERFSSPDFVFDEIRLATTESSSLVPVSAIARDLSGAPRSVTALTRYVTSYDFGKPDPGWKIQAIL